MRAIIIDDEPRAISLLEKYLGHFEHIQVARTFRNGFKALEYLSGHAADLVFLDINMPHLSGISISKMLDKETQIIFTTAHSEYALESYEVQAVDYLLKPISFERFTQAMGKVTWKQGEQFNPPNHIIVKSGSRLHRIDPENIIYLEKDGNYITYYLTNDKVLGRATVEEAMKGLPEYFVRVHKSFIVNANYVSSIERSTLFAGKTEIPVGASFQVEVKKKLFA